MKQFFQWMNQDENIRSAVAAFSQPGCHSIYGLSGSVKSALVAKALTEKPGQAVLVVPSREQAAAWMADLAFLVPDLPVLDFPSLRRRPRAWTGRPGRWKPWAACARVTGS